ncbi:enhancer of rudimentary family protein [Gilbertella persicaria]|uniref:enhancer of rudimentary family protein n=1 Tax=Gilbertella persicaria TaxID=101096 RepID=UPI00221F9662|nr:enhancer of rudimentary family protein [Gilbertella persicaria]KAI8066289.1 enhancer of rudimentary family protein [Gilbertella persicaria]
MSNHTILLLQANQGQSSRTYYDFPTESEAMDHIAGLYELRLAKENPNAGQVQYRAEDLFRFIDTYKEFVGLVFDPKTNFYQPRDKEWIKDRLIAHFSQPQPDQSPAPQRSHGRRRNR